MDTHVRILAVIRIVLGAIGALIAIGLLLLFGGIAGFVGTVATQQDPDAWIGVGVLSLIGTLLFLVIGIISLPSIVAGIGLLKYRSWARWLTIVISALDLLNVPFGTAAGIYGLWVLLSAETEALFRRHSLRQAA